MKTSSFTTGISELVLVVKDVEASARFSGEVVGLAPMTEAGDEWAWFWTGKLRAGSRLAVHKGTLLSEEHSPHPQGRRFGQIHFALQVPRDQLEAHCNESGTTASRSWWNIGWRSDSRRCNTSTWPFTFGWPRPPLPGPAGMMNHDPLSEVRLYVSKARPGVDLVVRAVEDRIDVDH